MKLHRDIVSSVNHPNRPIHVVSLFIVSPPARWCLGQGTTLTPELERQLDGCYIGVPRIALGIHRSQRFTISELCGKLPTRSGKIRE